MRYRVRHTTSYSYEHEVSVAHHIARVTPRALTSQTVLDHQLLANPAPTTLALHTDYFGNPVAFLTLDQPHQLFSLTSDSKVHVRAAHLPDPNHTPPWESIAQLQRSDPPELLDATEFAFPSTLVPQHPDFADFAAPAFTSTRPILAAALDLIGRIHSNFTFDPAATTTTTTVEETLRTRRGVCQDFAHLALACLRSLHLPARYVSGYLETIPPPGQPRLAGADASHAWISIFCPGHGWIDLDPTNNLCPSDRHVTVAWGRDFSDVSPVRGVLVGSGHHTLSVAVDLTPIPEP